MVLAAGTRLGNYEITGPLGVGGMGEVYRATDAKLGRAVAIKTLPAALASDKDRLARFEREAKLLAALNHAHIAAIYGLDEHDGTLYLAMELVEGETLEAKLKRGALPIDEALRLGLQIAEALEAAHVKGIVHRDLKPANVMVTRDGVVKVLDFGLAKAFSGDPNEASPLHSPALSLAMTQQGLILGTAGYMSPEQASGQATDQRADIFAFGVVLYEMLTGLPVFSGESVPHILAAVLQTEPDWNRLPKNLHPRIRAMLERCLAKRPRNRYAGIADARVDIEAALADPRGLTVESPATSSALGRVGALGWIVAALALALLGWFGQRAGDSTSTGIAMTIVPPMDTLLPRVGSLVSAPELSPDGSAVLFEATGGLYIRRLDSLTATLVPGSDRVTNAPFWSADSHGVFYSAGADGLIKVPLPDGAPEVAMPDFGPSRRGSTRDDDGALLVSTTNGLQWLAPGSQVRTITVPGLSGGRILYPEFLPNSDLFIFLWRPDDRSAKGVYLASIDDQGRVGNPALLVQNETAARYTPAGGGSLLFVRDDRLYAQHLDVNAQRLTGDAHLVQDGVGWNPEGSVSLADFSVSRSGDVAWRPGTAALARVTTFDRKGTVLGTSGPPLSSSWIKLSPDGTRLLVAGERSWLLDVDKPGRVDLGADITFTLWSADGKQLIGQRGDRIVERDVDGGDVRDLGAAQLDALAVSPDGKELLGMNSGYDSIMVQRLDGSSDGVRPLVTTGGGDRLSSPVLSPDGDWILYRGDGGLLYVQPYPGPGARRVVSAIPGVAPVWRGDGKEILFAAPPGTMYAVSVNAENGGLQFGEPDALFTGVRRPAGALRLSPLLAVSRDGSRIYWIQSAAQPASDLIHVRTRAVQ
jgi:eukaryotic-like serine/threonine-protein kinase